VQKGVVKYVGGGYANEHPPGCSLRTLCSLNGRFRPERSKRWTRQLAYNCGAGVRCRDCFPIPAPIVVQVINASDSIRWRLRQNDLPLDVLWDSRNSGTFHSVKQRRTIKAQGMTPTLITDPISLNKAHDNSTHPVMFLFSDPCLPVTSWHGATQGRAAAQHPVLFCR
jgi:hypothetical protein